MTSRWLLEGEVDVEYRRLPPRPPAPPACPSRRRRSDGCTTSRGAIAANVEQVMVGKPEVVRIALVTLLAEGHLLIEDVPGRGQDVAGQGAGPVDRLHGQPGAVHPRPAAQRHHRRLASSTATPATSSSGPARCSPTSWSATRSTAPPPRPSRRCWSAWRSGRSPSTGTTYPLDVAVHGASPPRTRSRWRAPTRCPRPSGTGSPARISIGYPRPQRRARHARRARRPSTRSTDLRPVSDADRDHGAGRRACARCTCRRTIKRYAVDLVTATRRLPRAAAGRLAAGDAAPAARRAGAGRAGRPRVRGARRRAAVAVPVLAHRLLLTAEALAARRSPADLIRSVLQRVVIPHGNGKVPPASGSNGLWFGSRQGR